MTEDTTQKTDELNRVLHTTKNTGGEKSTGSYKWEKHADNRTSQSCKPVLQSRVNSDILSQITAHHYSLLSNSNLLLTEDGILIRSMDPTSYIVVTTWIDRSEFEEYTVHQTGKIRIDWAQMSKLLSGIQEDTSIEFTTTVTENNGDNTQNAPYWKDEQMKYVIGDEFKLTGTCMNPELRPVPYSQSFPQAECNFTLPGVEIAELFSTIGDFANEFEIAAQDGSISITGEYQSKAAHKQYEDQSNISYTYGCEKRKFNPTITNSTSQIYQADYVRYFMKEATEQTLQSTFDIAFGNKAPLTVKRDIGDESFIMLTTAASQDNRYQTEN